MVKHHVDRCLLRFMNLASIALRTGSIQMSTSDPTTQHEPPSRSSTWDLHRACKNVSPHFESLRESESKASTWGRDPDPDPAALAPPQVTISADAALTVELRWGGELGGRRVLAVAPGVPTMTGGAPPARPEL